MLQQAALLDIDERVSDHRDELRAAEPFGLNVASHLLGWQVADDATFMVLLLIRCGEGDLAFAHELATVGLLVALAGQEHVGSLVEAAVNNNL